MTDDNNGYDIERAILGAILIDPAAFEVIHDKLNTEDFANAKHKAIFQAAQRLHSEGTGIDIHTVAATLEKMGRLDNVGGRVALYGLSESVATSGHILHHSQIIVGQSSRRRITAVGHDLIRKAQDPTIEPTELLAQTESALFSLAGQTASAECTNMGETIAERLMRAEEIQRNPNKKRGTPMGYYDLDYKTGGMEPGDMIVIAGRPSMGKTTLALNIATKIATDGNPIGLFSMETTKERIGDRLLCSIAGLDLLAIRNGRIARQELERAAEMMSMINSIGECFEIDDTPALRPSEMRSRARQMKLKKRISLLIVDHLQKMASDSHNDNMVQQVGRASAMMKTIAKELKIPVIVISQLSRPERSMEGKVPTMTDLRYSGDIEQDADIIMFVHRPEYYKEGNRPGEADIYIAKNRDGPTGKATLAFEGKYVRFKNLAREVQ